MYTISIFFLFLNCSIHSISDILSSGLELRPWEQNSKKSVYNHYNQKWIEPLHIIPYDGSKYDLLLLISLSIPLFIYLEQPYESIIILCDIIGITYTILRKILPDMGTYIIDVIPNKYYKYIPARYLE